MFTDIIKLIESKDYVTAIERLTPLLSSKNVEEKNKAEYLIGYINTRWDYKDKNNKIAERYLYSNLNSSNPQPMAYVLYADVVKDVNVAVNYLERGIQRFPDDSRIYKKLLQCSSDKNSIIDKIQERGLDDPALLGAVISYLIPTGQWSRISRFIFRINNGQPLDEDEKNYLKLIEAYACLFKEHPDYCKAQEFFKEVDAWDVDNRFSYSHFLGLIYALIKSGKCDKAIKVFDKLPVGNIICDFDDMPYPLGIYINFESIYNLIFEEIIKCVEKDTMRKNKAKAIYSMYLYYPSEIYDTYRYKKSDVTTLANYLKLGFNNDVAAALFNMRCHFKQFKEAYEIVWEFLKNYKDIAESDIFLSNAIDNIPEGDFKEIIKRTTIHIETDDYDQEVFFKAVFPNLVKHMFSLKWYEDIRNIAEYAADEDIINSECAFECAYAYGEIDNLRAIEIYKGVLKAMPDNTACINNLGVQYEHQGDLYNALECYENAIKLSPDKILYIDNRNRICKVLRNNMATDISFIADSLTIEDLESIGYTIDLCKAIHSIKDEEMKDILSRDLKECAIAVIACQDKLATIMCGSIIEALLMYRITELGISKYDIKEINSSKHAEKYPIKDMSLNELLYVAHKENLININSFHLVHYIRDYRNIVHPAKEKRMKEDVSHENVLTMWNVLLRIIKELL